MVIATKNKGKVKEFEALFERYGIKITSLLDINEPIPDIEETGTTFKENARLKAEGIAKVLNVPVVADDSGLAVDALEGALALAIPGKETIFTEGTCEGTIAQEPKGTNGFGYDPVFIPEGYDCTMAQLEQSEKNRISHRYHALLQLEEWLKQQMD